jgi:hypothetical protein
VMIIDDDGDEKDDGAAADDDGVDERDDGQWSRNSTYLPKDIWSFYMKSIDYSLSNMHHL